jgi:3-deoxy-D-manno-octulosonic acid (KDO) 8-phosphate synthase
VSSQQISFPQVGSCFLDASQAHLHKALGSALRAPVLGLEDWRVLPDASDKMMERRGWIQPLCTSTTTPEAIASLSRGTDRLYIPGEFCRQGDVLSAASESGKLILLERGAFLAPNDILRAVEKLGEAKNRLVLVEAGSSFGYSDRVLDPRALEVLVSLGCPVALNLNALSKATGTSYEHRPQWLEDDKFDLAFIRTALAFGLKYLILPVNREIHPAALELWMTSYKEQQ